MKLVGIEVITEVLEVKYNRGKCNLVAIIKAVNLPVTCLQCV